MKKAVLNEIVPDFSFRATNGIQGKISDYRGQNVVLYFYPRENTPGCTLEGNDFRQATSDFEKLETVIFGISRDSLVSHEKFKNKQSYPFELIDDSQEALCEIFDVMKMKKLYGKTVRGIERSTFFINKEGRLLAEWRNVKVPGHVAAVLEKVKELT